MEDFLSPATTTLAGSNWALEKSPDQERDKVNGDDCDDREAHFDVPIS